MRHLLFGFALILFVSMAATAQDAKAKKDPNLVTEIAGKSFSEWAKEVHAKDPADRETAIKTILNFGTDRAYEVVPDVIKELKKHNRPGPVDLSVRVNATIFLGAVFQAIQVPKDEHKKELLDKHVKDTVEVFKEALKEDKGQAILKIRTLQALLFLGPAARGAFKEVAKTVSDSTTWETRKEAIITLMYLVAFDTKEAPPPGTARTLADQLKDNSAIVRRAALQALVTVGQIDPPEKPKILGWFQEHLRDETKPIVRIEVHKSVINLRRKSTLDPIDFATKERHLDPLIAYLGNKDQTTRLNALMALGSIGPAAAPATNAVIKAMSDPDISLAITAMETLIHMEAFSAIPYLRSITTEASAKKELKVAADAAIDQLNYIQKHKGEEKKKTDNNKK